MAINRTSLSAQSIKQDVDITVQLLSTLPDTTKYLDTPVTPNIMVGYYNDITDTVQLYVTDQTGHRYIKVQ